jgi:peptide/nickel transport system substrate-binding protein
MQNPARLFRPLLLVTIAAALGSVTLGQDGPTRGGTLVVAYETEPHSLAPWRSGDANAHRIYNALYDNLVEQGSDLQIEPGLAERWEVSDDGLTYTFYLRQGVTFHNGEPFDAEVAKWNMDRWASPPDGYIFGLTSDVTLSEVVDEHTFRVHLGAPDVKFLIDLANKLRAVLPPGAVEAAGENFSFAPVGSGPFRFDGWITDSEIRVVRNDDYWRTDEQGNQLPHLDGMVFRTLPDPSTRHTALITGEIDMDTIVASENVADIETRDDLTIYNEPGVGYIALRLRSTQPPLDDVRVRQAIAWAVDREAVNDAAFFSLAFPGSTLYSPPTPGFDPDYEPYGRDLELARSLLEEAGYGNGFDLQVIASSPVNQIIAEVLQANLAEVGIRVNVQLLERGSFLDGIVDRVHESYVDRITGRTDPSDYYDHLECDALYNGHDYCNPTVDQMALRDGRANFSDLQDPARLDLYRQTERMVMEDSPLVILVHPPYVFAWNADAQDIVVTPAGRTYWTWAWKR